VQRVKIDDAAGAGRFFHFLVCTAIPWIFMLSQQILPLWVSISFSFQNLSLFFFFLCLSIWLSVFIELMMIWPDANLAVGEKLIPPNWINPTILPSSFLSPSDQMLQSR
jgi:hypothetical protein